MRERQTFGKDEDYYVLFTDNNGYMVTFRGARPMPTERYTRWIETTRRNIFYILRNRLKEPGMIFESQGSRSGRIRRSRSWTSSMRITTL